MTEPLFRVEMLGRLILWQGSREIHRFRTKKTSALLAYLAIYPQRSHPRESLTELFWPSSTLVAARTNLSVALNALRRQLEEPGIPPGAVLFADRSHVRLNQYTFTTDVAEFETLFHTAELEPEQEKRIALQITALDLYHGDLLPGYYEGWILTERDRLRDTYVSMLRQVVKGYAETRQYERAIEYSHRMVQTDPLREGTYHNLMRLYLAVGRPEDALHQYKALENLLQTELQMVPSTFIRELAEQLRQSIPSRVPSTDPRVSESRREEATSDTWRSTRNPAPPTLRLPFQFTRFFGREADLARLSQLLGNDTRLITLTGSGGTGKTRLSIEIAGRVKELFPGGLWFVPLAELDDPIRIGETIRDVLELPRQSHSPALEQVIAFLNALECPSLLILDNFEQIAAGGASGVWTLLNRVPSLRCLVTSRQPLSLPGERVIPVAPLQTPTMEALSPPQSLLPTHLLTYPSVALFVDRAQSARSEFQITPSNAKAIAAICAKLEGIPLAIELASARARVLSPSQMLERLSQRFELLATRGADKGERHRSLWAAIDWSYQLLPPYLQHFLARLSVFRGGWSLEAAEAICDLQVEDRAIENRKSEVQNPMVLDYLAQLRGHSFVFAEESSTEIRFRMLETIREFAIEKLQASAETKTVQKMHQNWFLGLAEEAEAQLTGPEQGMWLQRLATEHDNLRAALQFTADASTLGAEQSAVRASDDSALRLSGALCRFWEMHGHITEGRTLLAHALGSADARTPTSSAAKALNGAGMLALRQGDYPVAQELFEQALAINRTLKNRLWETLNLNNLGIVACEQADYISAKAFYERALAISREIGNRAAEALNLGNLGIIALKQEHYPESRALHAQALTSYQDLGDRFGEAMALHNIGNTFCAQEDYRQARTLFGNALMIDRELEARYAMIHRFGAMAILAVAIRQPERAARLWGVEEALREELGAPIPSNERPNYERYISIAHNAIGDAAAFDVAWKEGRSMSLSDAIEYALSEKIE